MTVRAQFRIWAIAFVVTIVFLYLLSDILLPFVAGMAVAYFLDPVADRLEDRGMSRIWATIVLTLVFFVLLTLALILLVPALGGQLSALVEAWPGYMARMRDFVASLSDGALSGVLPDTSDLDHLSLSDVLGRFFSLGTGALQNLASRSIAILNFIGLLFITPVVSFYLINDWDRIIERIDDLLPRQHQARIRTIAKEIDKVLAGFVRGMGSVCLILATFYAVALELAGLRFGLVVGITAGLISFIPFVGMAVGLILSVVLALFQFMPDRPEMVLVILAIFIVGQVMEGNFLTPKLVGKRIGLHPVWVIFGLLALGSLFGFVGMLLAVPLAAAIGVLVRHAASGYRESTLYWGEAGRPSVAVDDEIRIAEAAAPVPPEDPSDYKETPNDE